MNCADVSEHRYQHFSWHLPLADPQAWLAAAVALHHLFDAVFTGKIWVCHSPGGAPAIFSPIEPTQLSSGSISLMACHQQIVAACCGTPCEPGKGEHLIICGEGVDKAMVTRWQPRTALILDTSASRDRVAVTYLQQRKTYNDPDFPELLERALHGLLQEVLHSVHSTVDIAEAVRATLPEPTAPSQAIEVTKNLFIRRFAANVVKAPDRPAIVTGKRCISYSELARITDHLVQDWRYLKLSKGDRLIVIAPRGPEIVATFIAAFKAGVAVCLIDPRQPYTYVETCCRIVCPKFIVNLTGRDFTVSGIPEVTSVNLTLSDQEKAPSIRRDLFSADDCSIITLTSGTTSVPKAVMGRYSSLTHFFDWMNDRLGPMAGAAFGMCSSIGHDPLQRDIMTPLYLGGHIVIPRELDLNEPQRLSRWLSENRIEFVCLNAALVPWLASSTPLQHLRGVFCVGGALTRSQAVMLCAIAPNAQIVNLYGATETQRAVGFFKLSRTPGKLEKLPDVVPLGRGMKGVDLLVRDLSRPKLALPYQTGEIVLRSRYIALGYAADPELTKRKFKTGVVPGPSAIPTYLTGDLGYLSLCHGVVFKGRVDDQYKISGYRVELSAIDDACRQHPNVVYAATLVMEVDGLSTLVACIVPDRVMAQEELRHWLSQRLPHYMVPHRLCLLSDFPLTLNRKVDMRALAALVTSESGHHKATATDAHATKMLEQILAFVNRHTGQKHPPRDVALADLGIDSLRFLALISQLSSASSGEKLPLNGLHNGMSIAAIEQALADRAVPVSIPTPARTLGGGQNPRDLLGPAIKVTETRISFARGVFDHCCSNSYLGLAGCPEIRAQIAAFIDRGEPLGAHGSAELNGFTLWHEQLIAAMSKIHGCEAVLLYGSGYLANISAIPAVVSGGDHVFVDESCHQSLIDGCRLSGAKISVYRHNDCGDLESQLSGTSRKPNTVRAIVTEGVFSIEGDILDLPSVHTLARRFDCRLIVDEACSLGLLGADGSGVEAHFGLSKAIDIRTGSMAKALASTGGYVTCRKEHLMRLRFQRGASFSTSLSPLNAFIALQGAERLRRDGRALKASLDRNVTLWREGLNSLGFDTGRSSTAIVPILCADSGAATTLFQRALAFGVYTLPITTWWSQRVHAVRTSVTSAHEPERLRNIVERFAVGRGSNVRF